MDKVLLLVIDGCSPDYLSSDNAPNIFKLSQQLGFLKKVQGVMPSVTNVNHASILSGKWPNETHVIGNYFYDPVTKNEGFIEEKGYMKAETILHYYKKHNRTTALLTVKGKVLGVYGEDADIGISAQNLDPSLRKRFDLNPPPSIDSIKATEWILEAAFQCIKKEDIDFVYCTTNDYIFHHYAPGTPEASTQINAIDQYIKIIHSIDPQRQIYITADHGMNQKCHIINFQMIAKESGFDVYCLPPLKDRYIENHIYQEGGMLYVFLDNMEQTNSFYQFAKNQPYIKEILNSDEAAKKYHLPKDSIGNYVLLSAKNCAFGECDTKILCTNTSRTHGSSYELEVPLIAINPLKSKDEYIYKGYRKILNEIIKPSTS